ncbi:MAG TPA: prenyltransferase/squalene oxidase repeat-containing protein, partial [Chthoniobacteraceae bacterium]|nr:prenyltransferase/squalene oxidase repeat-containing protein [Chthoniobacteraceae bacterium]
SQYGTEPAVVALSMLSMLAHGEDPNTGPYHTTIHRCLEYILSKQNPDTGYIGSTMYNHGFSTLALAECYGQVQDPRVGPALQKAVDLILTSQAHNPNGAWRYSPESPDADTTVSGAQMVALFAARNAGIGVPEDAINKGLKFFASCQTPDGGIGYTGPGGPNSVRTSIGALCFSLAKQDKGAPCKSAYGFLKAGGDGGGDQGPYHEYYLYYSSQAMFRAGPAVFNPWNAENVKLLVHTQTDDGSWAGQLGPTFSTAASLLSLALNYRLLPIYER